MIEVVSPLTNGPVSLKETYSAECVIKQYQDLLNIDVSRFFPQESFLQYECIETGYNFFYPHSLAGDDRFYEELENLDWYYMPWKWEHKAALEFLQPGASLIEIGCGQGGFLEGIKKYRGIDGYGIELNKSASKKAKEKGLLIYDGSLLDFVQESNVKYDVICTFQVLEHIYDVKSFVELQISLLKPGGLLIVSVPNNDSYLKFDFNILNLPPHHFGLWNTTSLRSLEKYFPLKTQKILFEPLQHYHESYFHKVMCDYFYKKINIKLDYTAPSTKMFWNTFKVFCSQKFMGFSVLAVYKKI